MDYQYTNSVTVQLITGTLFLEPSRNLRRPLDFKKYVAHEDENLFILANRFYGDTSMWYLIAKFSSVIDPTNIPVGTTLLLPVYDDKSPEDLFV